MLLLFKYLTSQVKYNFLMKMIHVSSKFYSKNSKKNRQRHTQREVKNGMEVVKSKNK